jgi:hypothetical protein
MVATKEWVSEVSEEEGIGGDLLKKYRVIESHATDS